MVLSSNTISTLLIIGRIEYAQTLGLDRAEYQDYGLLVIVVEGGSSRSGVDGWMVREDLSYSYNVTVDRLAHVTE